MKYHYPVILACLTLCTGCSAGQVLTTNSSSKDVVTQVQGGLSQLGEGLQTGDTASAIKSILQQQTAGTTQEGFTYPVAVYPVSRTALFGSYVSGQYLTGDTITLTTTDKPIAITAIIKGSIVQVNSTPDLGDYVVFEFIYQDKTYHAIYSHLDGATINGLPGATVELGQTIAILPGDAAVHSWHFSIYTYNDVELLTEHVVNIVDLNHWVDPFDFLRSSS